VAIPGIIGTTADIVAFVARLLYRLGRLVKAGKPLDDKRLYQTKEFVGHRHSRKRVSKGI